MGEHFHFMPRLETIKQRLKWLFAAEIVPDARYCLGWKKAAEVARHANRFIAR